LLSFALNFPFTGEAKIKYLSSFSTGFMISFQYLLSYCFYIRIHKDGQGWVVRAKDPSKKLIDLGFRFTPFDKTIKDAVDCLGSRGLI
jgi:hypothetical protein